MTQNVLAAVDFDGRFVTVAAGCEGSAHDSLVLRRTLEKGFTVPEGRFYLVDGGYANTHQFLSPYRGKTYHLAQFSQRSRDSGYENTEELFNHRHAQLRNVVEKAFGILKGRFKILKEMHNYKYGFQVDMVLACCLLHNFISLHQNLQGDNGYYCEETPSDSDDDSADDIPSTSEVPSTSDLPSTSTQTSMSGGTNAQRGAALRNRLRDLLWNGT